MTPALCLPYTRISGIVKWTYLMLELGTINLVNSKKLRLMGEIDV